MQIEEIEKLNKNNFEESKKQFNEFRNAIHVGKCSLCDKSLNYFNESEPCLHWLLKPSGFKKKHLPLINSMFGHERIQSFLRWYVNSFDLFVGINDLDEEHAPGKIMAVTIKHGDLEWSFNISPEDLKGIVAGHHIITFKSKLVESDILLLVNIIYLCQIMINGALRQD